MAFSDEADFERALITVLFDKGWSREVIKYPTEKDLIRNWADILYRNNCTVDRLDKYPLTDSEMGQILDPNLVQIYPDADVRQQVALREVIAKTLDRNGGNRSTTAEQLGLSRRTIQRKIQELGLE